MPAAVDRDEVRSSPALARPARRCGARRPGRRARLDMRPSPGRARSAPSARRDRRDRSARRPARARNRGRRDRRRGRHKRAASNSAIRCQATGLRGPRARHVEPLELLQDREHRRRARRGRPHAANPVAAIASPQTGGALLRVDRWRGRRSVIVDGLRARRRATVDQLLRRSRRYRTSSGPCAAIR